MKFCVIVISGLIFGQAIGLTIGQETQPPFNILKSAALYRTVPIKNFFNLLQGNQLRYGGQQARSLALSGANTGSFSQSGSFSAGNGESKSSSSSLSFTGLPSNVLFNTLLNRNNMALSQSKDSRSSNVDNYRSKIDVRFTQEHPSEWSLNKAKSHSGSANFRYNHEMIGEEGAIPSVTSFASSSSGSTRSGNDVFSHSYAESFSNGMGASESSAASFISNGKAFSNSNTAVVAPSASSNGATESKNTNLGHSGLFITPNDANEKSHSLSGSIKSPNVELGSNTFLIKEEGLEQHGFDRFSSAANNVVGNDQKGWSFSTSQTESGAYQSVNGNSSFQTNSNVLLNQGNRATSGNSQASSTSINQNGESFSNSQSESVGIGSTNGEGSSISFHDENGGSFNTNQADFDAFRNTNGASFSGSGLNNGAFSGNNESVPSTLNNQNGGSFSNSKAESVSAQNIINGGSFASSSSATVSGLHGHDAFSHSQNVGSFSGSQAKSSGNLVESSSKSGTGIFNGNSAFSGSQADSLVFNSHTGGSFSSSFAGSEKDVTEAFSSSANLNGGSINTNGEVLKRENGGFRNSQASGSSSNYEPLVHNIYLNRDVEPFEGVRPETNGEFGSNGRTESSFRNEKFGNGMSSFSAGFENSAFGNSEAGFSGLNSFTGSESVGLLNNRNVLNSKQAGSIEMTNQNSEASSLAHNIFLQDGVRSFAESQSGSTSTSFQKNSHEGSSSERFPKITELFSNPNAFSTFSKSYAESSSDSGLLSGNFAVPADQHQTFSSSKSEASSGTAAYQHGTLASNYFGVIPKFVNKGNISFSKSHASSGTNFSESKSESFSGSF